jgi:hypothetical protein
MKKLLIVLGIIILAFIAILIIVPIAFKPQLVKMAKEKVGQNINAIVDFKDISLSLLKSFPNASVGIDNLVIVNREPFAGDTLATLDHFEVTLNLSKLLFKKEVEILSLKIGKPRIAILTLKDGTSNYQIFPTSGKAEAAKTETTSGMSLALKHYEINDAYLLYANDSTAMYAEVIGLNHSGNGDFTKSLFTLSTHTKIDSLSFKSGNIPFLSNAELEVKADLDMDMGNKKFTFKNNEIRLNQLLLAFDGWLQIAGENTNIDLTFKAPQTDFKNILSMVPAIYKKDFRGISAEGQLTLEGKIQGTYNKNQVPMMDIRLLVDRGQFQYPGVPNAVKAISIDFQVRNPGKTINDTEIDLRRFHAEFGNEPVDAQLLVQTPVSDPYVDGYLKGNINLAQIRSMIPMNDSVHLAGVIRSDFRFKGKVSSVQSQNPQNFSAAGSVVLDNIEYGSPALPEQINVKAATLNFTPQQANLSNFNMQMGKSDLQAQGGLDNVFGYVLGNQTLTGILSISSNYLNLNPFLQQKSGPLQAVELPDRVDFQMNGAFKEILITNMNMTNVKGRLLLRNRQLTLDNLTGDFLGGSMVSNGTYTYLKPNKPHVDFDLRMSQLNIPDMYKTFMTVQQLAPMAGYMQGQVSGNLNISSDLGDSLMPLWQTILSSGSLQIPKATIQNFEPLNRVASALKLDQFKNPAISNLAPSFDIQKGFFNVHPVSFKIANYDVIASGGNGLDKTLDYQLKVQIPAAELKSSANSAISSLLNRDINLLTNETVVVNAFIKGPITSPNVTTSLAEVAKGAGQQLKQQAEQEVQQRKQQLENEAQQRINEQKAAVEDSLKKEAEKRGGEEIKNKLKGLFGR